MATSKKPAASKPHPQMWQISYSHPGGHETTLCPTWRYAAEEALEIVDYGLDSEIHNPAARRQLRTIRRQIGDNPADHPDLLQQLLDLHNTHSSETVTLIAPAGS